MNKKSQIMESIGGVFQFFIFLLAFVVIISVLGTVLFEFGTAAIDTGVMGNETTNPMITVALEYPTFFDYIPMIVYVLMIIASVAIARVTPFERAWVGGLIVLYIIFSAAIMFAGNILIFILQQTSLAPATSQLIITPIIAEFSLPLGLIYMFIVFIALLVNKE